MTSLDPDYDLTIQTYSTICPRYESVGFKGLTEHEQVIFCTWQFVCEVNNGGLHQYFLNPSGEFSRETVDALKQIPMPFAESILIQALTAFPHPSKDQLARAQQLGALPYSVRKTMFERWSEQLYNSDEDPYLLQAQYIRKNRAGFLGL